MRELNITGGRKKQRQVVEDVVKWSIKKLNLHRIRTLNLTFSIKSLKSLYGQLEQLDDKRREFSVVLDKNADTKDLIRTVIHEMVHVKQYIRKEMDSEVVGSRMRWKSKTYPYDIKYDDMPWEKEANRLETKYGNEYLKEIGI
tara:strand:- start:1496 stop:1924 length:429 start_codon:yes stop_codon:yes gene_type:complete